MQNIQKKYLDVPAPPNDIFPEEALRALLGSSKVYVSDRPDLMSYDKSKVAWPPVGSAPVNVVDVSRAADSEMLNDWQRHLLLGPDERRDDLADEPVKPYCDPVLMRSALSYGEFISELARRGLVGFTKTP